MNRIYLLAGCATLVLAVAAWMLITGAPPKDTRYFHWKPGNEGRYELVVSYVSGNPEFRQGVMTPPVPQSGVLRVIGSAEPGALVEVSNPRTGRGFATAADDSGAFAVNAEARRGDELKVISRKVEFRAVQAPRYSSSAESSP
jgi:nucleoid-associated protein YgaU